MKCILICKFILFGSLKEINPKQLCYQYRRILPAHVIHWFERTVFISLYQTFTGSTSYRSIKPIIFFYICKTVFICTIYLFKNLYYHCRKFCSGYKPIGMKQSIVIAYNPFLFKKFLYVLSAPVPLYIGKSLRMTIKSRRILMGIRPSIHPSGFKENTAHKHA